MNSIKIGKYIIRQSDALNVILEKESSKSNQVIGYYANITNALIALSRNHIADKDWQSVEELKTHITDLRKTIEKVGKDIGKLER